MSRPAAQSHDRPPRTRAAALIAAATLQLVLALGLVTPSLLGNIGAIEVLLQTQPVDPRDPLRGHYLTLGYSVNRLETELDLRSGQTVYVPISEDENGVWNGTQVLTTPPESGVFLRGKVNYTSGQTASINYGIERFYLEESLALDIERSRWQQAQPLKVYVRVGKGGQARVVGLRRGDWELR